MTDSYLSSVAFLTALKVIPMMMLAMTTSVASKASITLRVSLLAKDW
jgi:hypothetical protein